MPGRRADDAYGVVRAEPWWGRPTGCCRVSRCRWRCQRVGADRRRCSGSGEGKPDWFPRSSRRVDVCKHEAVQSRLSRYHHLRRRSGRDRP